jgi:sugar lactone lactonase YvrE
MVSPIVLLLVGAALVQAQQYVISTFAGGGPPPTPVLGVDMPIGALQSVATDALGDTYFVASHCVFRMDLNGIVTRIAGNGRAGYLGDGGPASSAQLRLESINFGTVGALPPGVAVDNGGNVYVADNGNYRIRKISPNGIITTVAGNGTSGFAGDGGPATSAQLSPVFGLAVDAAGNLLIADSGTNRIRRVTPDGSIATLAGTGDCGLSGDGGSAVSAQICGPAGIAADTAGNLFIADLGNDRIRQISPDGTITTVAGSGPTSPTKIDGCAPSGDGGPAASARLCLPSNVAVDRAGNLFVADTNEEFFLVGWQVVRKISPSGIIVTVAGFNCLEDRPACDNAPGNGTIATETLFFGPLGLAVDTAGNLLIADDAAAQVGGYAAPEAPHIYKVLSGGALAAVVGNGQDPFPGDGGPATSAQLASPAGVTVDSGGNVFVADSGNNRIRKITPEGIITTVAGIGNGASSGDSGPATRAEVAPIRIAVDGAGDPFFFDLPNRSIRKVSPEGLINTVIHVGGNKYFVALDRASDLFIADPTDTFYAIVEVSPKGTIRRVAGGATDCGTYNGCSGLLGDGGPATSAQLVGPQGVAVDGAGNIFIADTYDQRIRKVTPDGIITTIAGNSPTGSSPGDAQGGFSGDSGPESMRNCRFPLTWRWTG